MLMLKQATLAALLVAPASGRPVWTPSNVNFDRRLDIATTRSHTDETDNNCVVGAFDEDNPTHIYVGGPCSELGEDNTPSDNFRWVEMYTFLNSFEDLSGNVAELEATSEGFVYTQEPSSHAEVAVGGYFQFQDPEISMARVFASATSYLAKSTVDFNKIDFVTGQTSSGYEFVNDVCVEQCCASDCSCSGCPDTMTTALAGDYKYSIFLGAYDQPGASENGWAKTVDKYGTLVDGAKQLQGYYNVYQAIDFTNMQADTLTVTSPSGASTTYSSMSACSHANLDTCTTYSVESVLVEEDSGFKAKYSFPMTYNKGSWTKATSASAVVTTPENTKTVQIRMIKPDDAWLAEDGLTGKKIVLLEYKFDVTGMTGTELSGTFMVYDPTVQNADGSNAAPAPAPGSASGSASHSLIVIQLAWPVATWLLALS